MLDKTQADFGILVYLLYLSRTGEAGFFKITAEEAKSASP
jgi:hypothetical protein